MNKMMVCIKKTTESLHATGTRICSAFFAELFYLGGAYESRYYHGQ